MFSIGASVSTQSIYLGVHVLRIGFMPWTSHVIISLCLIRVEQVRLPS